MELNMSDLVTSEELEKGEDVKAMPTINFNRQIYCSEPDRIVELVNNVFAQALRQDEDGEDIFFYESSDNYIKWSTDMMDQAQLVVVEGLLSHRMTSTNLLDDMYTDEKLTPLRVFPSNATFLQGTVFLGGIKDIKQYNDILENVVRVAGIPIEDNDCIACFTESIDKTMPQATIPVMAIMGLDTQQMSNLKNAAKIKRTADKVKKATSNISTTGVALTKTAMDGIAIPLVECTAKIGGTVAGGTVVGSFKGVATFSNEVVASVVHADLGNYTPYQELKTNSKKLFKSLTKSKTKDSYSFNF